MKREEFAYLKNYIDMEETVIRGIDINTTGESKHGFEFFNSISEDMIKEMDCFIKYAEGKKSFLDVGAGHGIFSLIFNKLNPCGHILSIEPDEDSYKILIENTEDINNISLKNVALSGADGDIIMKKSAGGFSAVAEFDWEKDCVFQALKGDSLYTDIPFDIIKIDTEGNELDVLKGLAGTITKNHPVIFLEMHHYFLKEQWLDEMGVMIDEWGYKIINTKDEQPITLEQIKQIKEGETRIILL